MNKIYPKNLWIFIAIFLKPYKFSFIIFFLLAVLTGFWAPINTLLLKNIIDTLSEVSSKNISSKVFWLALFFVLNFEAHNLCWRGMGYINYKLQQVVKNQLITQTLNYVHQHSYQFFQENLSGKITNQINRLADNVERIVHDISRHIIRTIVLLICTFISMYYVHPQFFYGLFIWVIIFSGVES